MSEGVEKSPAGAKAVEDSPPGTFIPPGLEDFYTPFRPIHGATTVAMILLLDYLLYQGSGGLSYVIIFAIFPVVTALFALKASRPLPLLAFGSIFFLLALRCAWQSGPLAIMAGFALLLVLPIALRLRDIRMPDILSSLPVSCLMGAVSWGFDIKRGMAGIRGAANGGRRTVSAEAVGIPFLICVAFLVVFFLSNPILQDSSQRWYDVFEGGLTNVLQRYAPNALRVFFWSASIVFAGILLRPAILRAGEDSGWYTETVPVPNELTDTTMDYRIAMNTLIGVNSIFFLYNGMDAYYLLLQNTLPAGLNHSQYAHRGALWLTVALAMTTFVVGWIFHGSLNFHEQRKALLRWTGFWLAQNFLLALWVFLRVHMYVGYNGMTRMRIVAITGTMLVVVGLILVTVKAVRRLSLTWLVRKELGAFFAACLILALLPTDYISWRYNSAEIMSTTPPRTSVQLTRQAISPEGLVTLTGLLEHPDPIIAEGAAGVLGRWYFGEGQRYAGRETNLDRWTHFQASHARCARILAAHEERILALVPDRDWNVKINALREYTGPWI